MDLSDRQTEILAQIRQLEKVEVDQLADHYQVSTQTIRRDLNTLCDLGLAARTHGGARQVFSIANVDYHSRRHISSTAKITIGECAAGLIPNDCSLIINVGTTTEQVAAALREHRNLIVMSNNINVINILSGTPAKELILAGGTVRQSDGAVIGASAVEMINRFKVDYAIIGCSAIDDDGTILDFDAREVTVARAILRNARTTILVADKQKFARSASVRICQIEEIDHFVTDKKPSASFMKAAEAGGTHIHIAKPSLPNQTLDTSSLTDIKTGKVA